MQRKTGDFRYSGTGLLQAACARQGLQAEGLAALVRGHGNTVGNGTAQHSFQPGLIRRFQRQIAVVLNERSQNPYADPNYFGPGIPEKAKKTIKKATHKMSGLGH
jgi:hypothetical protein